MVRDERAQLLLVAAITVAVFIVSFSVVFNGVIFTEQRTGGDADIAASGAEQFSYEVRETTANLLVRVNHATVYGGGGLPDAHDAARTNIQSNYGPILASSYGASSPVAVNVTYDETNSTLGSRVVQRSDGGSTTSANVAGRAVGWFTLNVNASETDGFTVSVENQTETVTYDIERNSHGPGLNVTVSGDVSQPAVTCEQTGDRVLIDLVAGTAFGDDCEFPSFRDELVGPYDVTFEDENDASLRYELVVNGTGTGVSAPDCTGASGRDVPCRSDAVWVAHVETQYDRARVSYQDTQNVSVYGGGV
ncbi:hypothetical protein [Haloferax mucosum]|uniref:hypothetical protein n=1 Tax=Haloferax mucosum TaxID=403181 RepID=UPI0003208C17|nr:hypothetical protein [Haloferax mucosum]